jgi:hypothetical protein
MACSPAVGRRASKEEASARAEFARRQADRDKVALQKPFQGKDERLAWHRNDAIRGLPEKIATECKLKDVEFHSHLHGVLWRRDAVLAARHSRELPGAPGRWIVIANATDSYL